MFNFEQLIRAVDSFVTSYKSDFDIDRSCFRNNTPFVHIAMKCGTRMVTKDQFFEVANRVIKDPQGYTKVLFGQVHNSQLLDTCKENAVHTCEYNASQKTETIIHVYDGRNLRKHSDNSALESIINMWYKSASNRIKNLSN